VNKISKDKALEIISHSKGRFLSISGIKKDGSIRHYKSSKFNDIIYSNINVLTRDGYRNIVPSGIFYLKADKKEYAVA